MKFFALAGFAVMAGVVASPVLAEDQSLPLCQRPPTRRRPSVYPAPWPCRFSFTVARSCVRTASGSVHPETKRRICGSLVWTLVHSERRAANQVRRAAVLSLFTRGK